MRLAQRKRLTDAVPLLTPKDEDEDPYEGKTVKAVKPAQVIWRLLESLMEKHDGVLWSGHSNLETILDVIEVSQTWRSRSCPGFGHRYTSARLPAIYHFTYPHPPTCGAAHTTGPDESARAVLRGRRSR
jgi:hypothetical protein